MRIESASTVYDRYAAPQKTRAEICKGSSIAWRMAVVFLAGMVTMALFMLAGCATGQQGQGETRAIQLHGAYIENLSLTVAEGTTVAGLLPPLFSTFTHTGDSDQTLQPSAEGSASATNAPNVEARIPITPGG